MMKHVLSLELSRSSFNGVISATGSPTTLLPGRARARPESPGHCASMGEEGKEARAPAMRLTNVTLNLR